MDFHRVKRSVVSVAGGIDTGASLIQSSDHRETRLAERPARGWPVSVIGALFCFTATAEVHVVFVWRASFVWFCT